MGLSTDGRLYIFAEGSENYLALHSNDAGTSDIYSVQQLYFMCGDNDFSFMHNGYGDSYLRVNVDGTYPQIQSGNSIIDFTRLLGRSPVFRIDLSGTDPILTSDSGTISFDDENLSTTGTLTASDIILTEQSANPTIPSDGEAVIWLSDGTEYGDAGDVMIASATGG
ncbi:MAG: hypothetical protein KGD67_11945, partial [Candidatus Lokiarchaeota archaeon]|nr:hypothetical protein [Candidatus Lokiarchaeota archaeon]